MTVALPSPCKPLSFTRQPLARTTTRGVENEVVRAARASSRLNQIAYLKKVSSYLAGNDASLAVTLFQMERLADALAEGEFGDMGLDKKAGEEALARLIHGLRTPE